MKFSGHTARCSSPPNAIIEKCRWRTRPTTCGLKIALLVVTLLLLMMLSLLQYREPATAVHRNLPPAELPHSSTTAADLSRPVRSGRDCYTTASLAADLLERLDLLPDVLDPQHRPSSAAEGVANIFFHETSCLQGVARLNRRQACAIESAARANPASRVHLLYASPVGFERHQPRPDVFGALAHYPNVVWLNLNLWTYSQQTPAEHWIRQPALFASRYLIAHTADMLRLMSLFKWGGTHLDLDFVMLRPFGNRTNFACLEDTGIVANGLINFAADGVGHRLAERVLAEFVRDFRGAEWAANGPVLLTRLLREMCGTEDLYRCPVFRVWRPESLYAVYYTQWRWLFEAEHTEEVMRRVNESVAVHFWNKLSAGTAVRLGEGSAYERLAEQHCPRVYETALAEGVF